MESTSTDYISPSFSVHSFNNISNIADRVVDEFLTENGLDNEHVFSFSDDDNPTNIAHNVDANNSSCSKDNIYQEKESVKEDDQHEFEFSVAFNGLNLSPVTTDDVFTGDKITSYPLFDRSLLLDLDICSIDHPETNTESISTSAPAPALVSTTTSEIVPAQVSDTNSEIVPAQVSATTSEIVPAQVSAASEIVPATDVASTSTSSQRRSLMNLFIEDRDSPSTSSSEADDLEGLTPDTYCVWKPEMSARGKHRKSNSISIGGTSKRWKVRDLLKRSYSDDSYGKDPSVPLFSTPISPKPKIEDRDSPPVVLFLPPISPKRKMHIEKVKNIEKIGKVAATSGVAATKTEHRVPAYKTKIGNIRVPPYLPYREDQLAAYANYNGSNKHMYRY
ncbi:uncharacterized protein [Rutidosis leptorrhynchoides]|uniref:uncharacterized protein n=1 Tax=Rutidosis leptorrhynchoides TaxID=125765 RepID=UPI003A9A59A0